MNIFLQFKLGICSVFWLRYLCVLQLCIWRDFLWSVSAHLYSSCPGCSFGWRQDRSHCLNLLVFLLFGKKLCNCQISEGSLQPLWLLLVMFSAMPHSFSPVNTFLQTIVFCDDHDSEVFNSEGNPQICIININIQKKLL